MGGIIITEKSHQTKSLIHNEHMHCQTVNGTRTARNRRSEIYGNCNPTHPIESTRCRDSRGTHSEVLDEAVDANMLVLHVGLWPDIGAAPGPEDRQEAGTDVCW